MVLLARSALDARTGVHSPRSRDLHRLRDVRSVEPPRDNDLPPQPPGNLPIEPFAGAAVQLARGTVQEQRLGIAVVLAFEVEAGADLERLPKPANRVGIPGRFPTVQLRDMELG